MPLSVEDIQQQLDDQQLREFQVQQEQIKRDQDAKAQQQYDRVSVIDIIKHFCIS